MTSLLPQKTTTLSMPVYPPYYEIRDANDNLRACLFGTDHNLAPNTNYQPAPEMRRCFDRATVLLVEADKPAVLEIFKKQLAQKGVSQKAIEAHMQSAFQKEALSMDAFWERLAKETGKPIQGLESVVDAFNAAVNILHEDQNTPAAQHEVCREWIIQYLSSPFETETRKYFQYCFIQKDKTLPAFYSRNEVMANGIYQESQRKSVAFVAVGFGHCLGENGVPSLLRKKYGFKVVEIKPNPPSKLEKTR